MEGTFSIRELRLESLVYMYLSSNPIFPRKFLFQETKSLFPFTIHPKFLDFGCKW